MQAITESAAIATAGSDARHHAVAPDATTAAAKPGRRGTHRNCRSMHPSARVRAVLAAAVAVMLLGCSSSQVEDHADAAVSLEAGDDTSVDVGGPDSAVEAAVDAAVDAAGDAEGGTPDSSCAPFPDSGATEGGLPPDDCSGYLYCDDFEAYDAGPLTRGQKLGPWTATGGGAIDAVRAYTGHQALHITNPSSGGLGRAVPSGIVPGNHVFGRAMFYFVEGPGDAGAGLPRSHSAFFRSTGEYSPADGGVVLDVAAGGRAGNDLWFNYFPPHHFEVVSSGSSYTTNIWHCLQWELDGTGAPPNQGRIWLDEQLVIDVPQSKGWLWATPWTNFSFGFLTFTGGIGPIDVSFDTFALDSKMIPCPPAPGCSP
jgi:hypothetical protein